MSSSSSVVVVPLTSSSNNNNSSMTRPVVGRNYWPCKVCGAGGCDVCLLSCGCAFHARCFPMFAGQPVGYCANCLQPVSSLQLSPMSFDELDQARKGQTLSLTSASANANASDKNGKKRKPMGGNPTTTVSSSALSPEAAAAAAAEADDGSGTNGNPQGGSSITNTTTATSAVGGGGGGEENGDLRTGRWTSDETEYCDALVQYFEDGKLPIPEGLKLNEFLSNMLKSKQARLTKKMKNAKLATRQYKRKMGYIAAMEEALAFSNLEKQFFCSIKCPVERAEIVFHVQKEWRELFSSYCIAMGQSLDATGWLISIEELDKRMSLQKDAARMVRRKVMLGHALSFDACNSVERGVYIDAMAAASANALLAQQQQQSSVEVSASTSMSNLPAAVAVSQSSLLSEANMSSAAIQTAGAAIHRNELLFELAKNDHNPMKYYSSPFIEKVMKLMDRLNIPFEHVDTWVPSFVSNDKSEPPPAEEQQSEPKCRLCFAGCATADNKIADEGIQNIPLTNDEKFDLLSFGEYSEKFSFDIGCGLPGRVYSSGVASWEQGIQNAPLSQFERSGGASQWGIQTVLGIPIPSPTAGRIVVIFYSTLNRPRNLIMVNRISEALSKLRPSPKWKLVVDVGVGPPPKTGNMSEEETILHHELLLLIQKCTPEDKTSPLALYLPGYTSLRLLLIQPSRSSREDELLKAVLASYASYKKGGHRSDSDIASMTARDFMLLSKLNNNVLPRQESAEPVGAQLQIQQHQPQHHSHDSDPLLAATLINLQRQSGGPFNGGGTINAHDSLFVGQRHANATEGGSDVNVDNAMQQFATGNQFEGHDFRSTSPTISPALHPIFTSQEQFAGLGASPTFHPITSDHDGISGIAPLGFTATQLSAMLQNESFRGL